MTRYRSRSNLAGWTVVLVFSVMVGVAASHSVTPHLARWLQPLAGVSPRTHPGKEEGWVVALNAYRRQFDLPALERDDRLHRAALGHSVDMLTHDFFEVDSPQRGTHQYRIWQAGITDVRVYCYIFKTNRPELADTITSNKGFLQNLLSPQLTHIGVGIVSGMTRDPLVGEVHFITAELAERYVKLPLPGSGRYSQREILTLSGEVAEGLRNPRLVVTQPDGRIIARQLAVPPDRTYQILLDFPAGAGEYKVEVEAENRLGPLVTNLFPVYVDIPPPDPAADYQRAHQQANQPPQSPDEAKQLMYRLINEERKKAALPALRYSFTLEDLAREHSQDMKDHDFFAHVSPRLGDLQTRARASNLRFRWVAENIAIDQSARKAHDSLMASPSHRANILHPRMTHVGIGIATGSDRRYGRHALWVTQHFAAFPPGEQPP